MLPKEHKVNVFHITGWYMQKEDNYNCLHIEYEI